ncbi:MAG: TadE/TadG family type IV pilus assembly protein [Thermomicrobiales bacterium]
MREVISISRLVRASSFRTRTTPRGRHTVKRGQSIVEFTLALPFLLMIMLGTIDGGRMFFEYVDLRSAAVEGAQFGSHNTADTGLIAARALGSGAPAGTSVAVSMDAACLTISTPGVTGYVTVTTSKTFTPFTTSFFLARFGKGSFPLSASSTMRCLT